MKATRKNRIIKYIIKKCGTPEDFVFDYIGSGSFATDIRRMREYVRHANKAEREYKKRYPIKIK